MSAAPSTVVDRRWFTRFGHRPGTAGVRLLCFHHAGGSAAMFRTWHERLPSVVDPVAVQLPGRAERFREPAFQTMTDLLDALVHAVTPLLDRPFACYGVSMGARVAWALTRRLRQLGRPAPRTLFLACDPAPRHDGDWPWRNRADGLEGYLREMGGTPPEVLADPDVLRALLPTLRADLAVLESSTDGADRTLDVPIHAFAGTTDPSATPEQVRDWREHTTGRFQLDLIPGGHFFDTAGERRVLDAIATDLTRTSNGACCEH